MKIQNGQQFELVPSHLQDASYGYWQALGDIDLDAERDACREAMGEDYSRWGLILWLKDQRLIKSLEVEIVEL